MATIEQITNSGLFLFIYVLAIISIGVGSYMVAHLLLPNTLVLKDAAIIAITQIR